MFGPASLSTIGALPVRYGYGPKAAAVDSIAFKEHLPGYITCYMSFDYVTSLTSSGYP